MPPSGWRFVAAPLVFKRQSCCGQFRGASSKMRCWGRHLGVGQLTYHDGSDGCPSFIADATRRREREKKKPMPTPNSRERLLTYAKKKKKKIAEPTPCHGRPQYRGISSSTPHATAATRAPRGARTAVGEAVPCRLTERCRGKPAARWALGCQPWSHGSHCPSIQEKGAGVLATTGMPRRQTPSHRCLPASPPGLPPAAFRIRAQRTGHGGTVPHEGDGAR
jgi:hypothetical protein